MTVGSFEVVFYTLAFVVPGFICDSVVSLMIPRRAVAHERSMLRFLTLSSLNYGLWSWLIVLMATRGILAERPTDQAVAWAVVIFVSPVALGMLLGSLSRRNTIRRLLERVGIYTVHPIPTAWDYFFSTTTPVWVLVTLRDGYQIAGRFGTRSFASSDPSERDLFVESIYRIEDQGPWTEVPMNEGIWIRGDDIRNVEFWKFS